MPETTNPSKHRRRGPEKSFSAAEQRRLLNRRHDQAVQIRKSRTADARQRKRQSNNAVLSSTKQEHDIVPLTNAWLSFLQQPDLEHLIALQNQLAVDGQSATVFFRKALEDQSGATARRFVRSLTHILQSDPRSVNPAIGVLLEIQEVTLVPTTLRAADAYYGSPPLQWSDLMLEEDDLMQKLLLHFEDSSVPTILTTILQDCPRAVRTLRSSWPRLVEALPITASCCEALVRQDASTPASDFLQVLTTSHITNLLRHSDESVSFAGAALLECLTRREDVAVEAIMRDGALVLALGEKLHFSVTCGVKNVHGRSLLHVFLQILGNIAVACEGHYVPMLISLQHQTHSTVSLVASLQETMQQRLNVEVLSVVGSWLCDAGLPFHLSTTEGVSSFIPTLLDILTDTNLSYSGTPLMEWQREAACALQTALSPPPVGPQALQDPAIEVTLSMIVTRYLWPNDAERKRQITQALVDLLDKPDWDAVTASLQILDRLLRVVPQSRIVMEECGAVRKLEGILDRTTEDLLAVDLAADLLDIFIGSDESDTEDDGVGMNAVTPGLRNDAFVFGMPTNANVGAFAFGDVPSATSVSAGRGRGRTLPAWMNNEHCQDG
jgi:hypothetical protein